MEEVQDKLQSALDMTDLMRDERERVEYIASVVLDSLLGIERGVVSFWDIFNRVD